MEFSEETGADSRWLFILQKSKGRSYKVLASFRVLDLRGERGYVKVNAGGEFPPAPQE